MKLRIAVAQFSIKQFNPEINLTRAKEFIKRAKLQKANVIVFPEDFITGPIMGKKKYVDFEGRYIRYFQNLAKEYSIDIIPGSFIEGDKSGWYNTSYYIDSHGKIKGKYRKINLWWTERRYLKPGNEISVFNTKFGKAGLLICWDLIFPETIRRMVKKGVKIVYCPSYWWSDEKGSMKYDKESEVKLINSICVSRAFENEIVFVFVNAAGKVRIGKIKDTLIGMSQITAPFKGVIAKLEHNKEDLLIGEIDLKIVKNAELVYKIRRDLKRKVV